MQTLCDNIFAYIFASQESTNKETNNVSLGLRSAVPVPSAPEGLNLKL